jgi:hypothetical protein
MPPHLITLDEVSAWLVDSAVQFAQDEFWAVAYYDEQVKIVLGDRP